MRRRRYALEAVGVTLLLWAVLFGFAFWRGDATWPHGATVARDGVVVSRTSDQEEWIRFATVALIVTFLVIKSYLMARRTFRWDVLGYSLIAANVVFAVIYAYAMAVMLWPGLARHVWIGQRLRDILVVVLFAGAIQLLAVPDAPEPWDGSDRRRIPHGRRGSDRPAPAPRIPDDA